jgi:hypothetical protein
MKTDLMHYLALIYFVSQPVHVSGIIIAHHQEVFAVYVQKLVTGSWLGPDPTSYQFFFTKKIIC